MSKPYQVPPAAPHRTVIEPDPPGPVVEPVTSLTKELTRVEEANLAFYEAITHRNIERMEHLWAKTPYVRCIHPGWELVVGWEDIRRSWQEIFQSLSSIEFQLEDLHVEVTGRTAWVNLVAYVHIHTPDGEAFNAAVVTTNILEWVEGQWLFVLHQSSNFAEDEGGAEDEDNDFDSGPGWAGDPN